MYASNSHSYTHLILALGIVIEPTVWVFITSKYPGIHDIGLPTLTCHLRTANDGVKVGLVGLVGATGAARATPPPPTTASAIAVARGAAAPRWTNAGSAPAKHPGWNKTKK